jgi:hypothetical protein
MSESDCRWTFVDGNGNKCDVRRLRLVSEKGRVWRVGPSRGRARQTLSWAKANRMLRQGKVRAVLALPAVGEVVLRSEAYPDGVVLDKHRRASSYRYGGDSDSYVGPVMFRSTDAEPTEFQQAAIADALLLSTFARTKANPNESKRHSREVTEQLLGRMLADEDGQSPPHSHVLPAYGFSIRDNPVSRRVMLELLEDPMFSSHPYPWFVGEPEDLYTQILSPLRISRYLFGEDMKSEEVWTDRARRSWDGKEAAAWQSLRFASLVMQRAQAGLTGAPQPPLHVELSAEDERLLARADEILAEKVSSRAEQLARGSFPDASPARARDLAVGLIASPPRRQSQPHPQRQRLEFGPPVSYDGSSTHPSATQVLAFEMHEAWRRQFQHDRGAETPQIREDADGEAADTNVPFHMLPERLREDRLAAASHAVGFARDLHARMSAGKWHEGDGLGIDDFDIIDIVAEQAHVAWLERQGSSAPAELRRSYYDLPADEQEKDRVIARRALELVAGDTTWRIEGGRRGRG